MMRSTRRACRTVLGVGLLTIPVFFLAPSGPGQPLLPPRIRGPRPISQAAPFAPSFTLPQDARFKKRVEALDDYIKAGSWPEALQLLQGMLDSPEDAFVAVPLATLPDGKETVRWTSVRAEASRMLAALPAEGKSAYEAAYGEQARNLLAEARRKNDPELLARVSLHYFHTPAGAEATRLLAVHHLDRGRFLPAAEGFRRFLQSGRELDSGTLYQAAVSFKACGDKDAAEKAWKQLESGGGDFVHIGDEKVALADLRKELEHCSEAGGGTGAVCGPVFRGDPGRSSAGASGVPTLEARWRKSTVQEPTAASWMNYALHQIETSSVPVVPGSVPVVAGDLVVVRTQHGVEAFDRTTGRLAWAAASEGGLDNLVADPGRFTYANNWVGSYLANYPDALIENSVVGTLSADRARVYAVEDLAVPPYLASAYGLLSRPGRGLQLSFAASLAAATEHSRLRALDLGSGKILWEVGGLSAPDSTTPAAPLDNSYFLGPPLPLGGRLYVITEKAQELRLVCLAPEDGRVEWVQTLGSVKDRLLVDAGRRLRAAPLAYGQGLLICPTNAGGVVAVDLLTHSLTWAYAYREEEPLPELPRGGRARMPVRLNPPPLHGEWKNAAPIVHGDKLVLGPTDAKVLSCLNLRDGSVLWQTIPTGDDVYVAGVAADCVLLVGKHACRALALADGRELWSQKTGLPSGIGMFDGSTYYLPLRKSVGTEPSGVPALCAIDVAQGTIQQRVVTDGQVPGNLVWSKDVVISQTATGVAAYPLGKERTDIAASLPEVHPAAPLDLSARGIDGLIRRLGSARYAEREEASQVLQTAGAPVLEALRKAVQSPDPEVHRRAERLLARVERQVETARLLAPQRVRLTYRDTPLPDAIADLAKKTGFAIELQGDALKLAERKITLDTGEITFWEAVDQVCRTAGISEPAAEVAKSDGRPAIYSQSVSISGNRIIISDSSRGANPYTDQDAKVVLGDGKPTPAVTQYAGAVRIRALTTAVPGDRASGKVALALDVTPEPRMQWQRVLAVRIEKAVDDQGQALASEPEPAPELPFYPPRRGNVFVGGVPLQQALDESTVTGNPRQVLLQFHAGARPSARLRELTGTIAAQVQTPPQPLMVVNDILKAKDKLVQSPAGGTLQILEVSHEEDGSIKVRAHLGAPLRRVEAGTGPAFEGVVFVNGRPLGEAEESVTASIKNFSLLDARGNLIPQVRGSNAEVAKAGRYTQEFELYFQPQPGQGEPARLVYSGWRLALVDVPFSLKEVPLP